MSRTIFWQLSLHSKHCVMATIFIEVQSLGQSWGLIQIQFHPTSCNPGFQTTYNQECLSNQGSEDCVLLTKQEFILPLNPHLLLYYLFVKPWRTYYWIIIWNSHLKKITLSQKLDYFFLLTKIIFLNQTLAQSSCSYG